MSFFDQTVNDLRLLYTEIQSECPIIFLPYSHLQLMTNDIIFSINTIEFFFIKSYVLAASTLATVSVADDFEMLVSDC